MADRTTCQATLSTQGEQADLLAAIELVLVEACSSLGGIALHAAAGIVDGQTWLMPGPSGTGKSTAARLAGFERIIGDERVLLLPQEDAWYAVSTPFWSAGRVTYPKPTFGLLTGILELIQAENFNLGRSILTSSLEWLMRSIVYYGSSDTERSRLLDIALTLTQSSAQYRVCFSKKGPWAWTLNHRHSQILSSG